ncbi:hypothetical protein LRP31_26095 [Mesorhizobium mediterraneum]|uniref:hypothetical protein n=1 Tax=Mesorhizobium TaxID=68287 RepID=UPI001FDA41CD|nr:MULTISPECIES: hypothetical protein [Mesorhizobium]WIW52494.1 hypothetical protein LRP31_26095 [Mesorhizobium mediterraneum]
MEIETFSELNTVLRGKRGAKDAKLDCCNLAFDRHRDFDSTAGARKRSEPPIAERA